MTPNKKAQAENVPAKRNITPKQVEFLSLVVRLIERESVSPTLAELAAASGVTKATAAAYVRRLRASGYLVDAKDKRRAIRPVPHRGFL